MRSSIEDRGRYRRVEDVDLTDCDLRVWLKDGRTLTVPLDWIPPVRDAGLSSRRNWALGSERMSIRWPDLSFEVAVESLLGLNGSSPYVSVKNVEVTCNSICAWLCDGLTLTVPLRWFPRLCDGTPEERNNWESPTDWTIRWPDLDEDITIDGLLDGGPTREGSITLGSWLLARRESRSVLHYEIVKHEQSLPRPVPLK